MKKFIIKLSLSLFSTLLIVQTLLFTTIKTYGKFESYIWQNSDTSTEVNTNTITDNSNHLNL